MSPEQLKQKIESIRSGTRAEITDLTGTEDHYAAIIVSPAFEGKTMIDQHRLIMDFLKTEIDSGEVHALTMKTYTPEQYGRLHGSKT